MRTDRFVTLWYVWMFAEQFIAIYPVYALMFEDAGLDGVAIASLFMTWVVAAFVLEVPSGALSDRFERHWILIAGGLVRGIGYGIWLVWPGYPGFLTGFLLWGAAAALVSGTREALLWEILEAAGRRDAFQRIWSRSTALRAAGGTLALPIGAWLASVGGYQAALIASIVVSLSAAALPWWFREPGRARPVGTGSYLALLRAGLREAWRLPPLRFAIAAFALLSGLANSYEEYTPLFLRELGVPLAFVGTGFALVYCGHIAGMALAAHLDPVGTPVARNDTRPLVVGAVAGVAYAAAGLAGTPALAVPALLLAYFGWGVFTIGLQSRIQHHIGGEARATVTSVAALGELGTAQVVFLGGGTLAAAQGWSVTTLAVGITLAAVAAALAIAARRR